MGAVDGSEIQHLLGPRIGVTFNQLVATRASRVRVVDEILVKDKIRNKEDNLIHSSLQNVHKPLRKSVPVSTHYEPKLPALCSFRDNPRPDSGQQHLCE